MDKLTTVFAFLATLSLATERIAETIKGLPFFSRWLAVEKAEASSEEARKATIHVMAIAIGTFLAYVAREQISAAVGIQYGGFWPCLLFGAMASGGSGLWNSALDIIREVNKQKQLVTEQLKKSATARK